MLRLLKHLYDWSFEDCVREVRGSLIYRPFCRIDCERLPDDKTLIRLAQALGPEVWKGVLERLVQVARQRKVVRGWKLRVDTTVVETNIHHPTDRSLLGDGVRVIARTLHKLRKVVGKLRFRDRTRSVGRRVFEIAQQSRQWGEEAQAGVKRLYRRLMGTSRAVRREAGRAVAQGKRRAQKLAPRGRQRVRGLCQQVKQMSELTQRVLEQTRARVLKGDTHYPHKVLSVFEPHSEAIRKGKKVKPTEFGKLVKVQEAENQFVTAYQVCPERVPDGELWEPSLERHQEIFGRPPHLATADAAFASAANEQEARARGVAPRGSAAPRALVAGPPGSAKAALVSAGDALAPGSVLASPRSAPGAVAGLSHARPRRRSCALVFGLFFNPRPLHLLPMLDRPFIPLSRPPLRPLTTPLQLPQDLPGVALVVANSKLLLDQLPTRPAFFSPSGPRSASAWAQRFTLAWPTPKRRPTSDWFTPFFRSRAAFLRRRSKASKSRFTPAHYPYPFGCADPPEG